MRQAIQTKYLPATPTKGPRVRAFAQAGQRVVDWNDNLSNEENHRHAAICLANDFDWLKRATLHGGYLVDGNPVFVVVEQ